MLLFEWDDKKANKNIIKHGVSFDEASTAFGDLLSFTVYDPLHSKDEDRFVLIGMSINTRVIVVVHTERNEHIRIISARIATRRERKYYENNAK